MAYIEKEPIIEFITKGLNNPDKTKAFGYDAIEILTEIEYAPTADVAPLSEVDRLQRICHSYALQYGTVRDQQKVIDEAKREVAREIFEEISKASVAWGCYCVTLSKGAFLAEDVNRTLTELKKKYTE